MSLSVEKIPEKHKEALVPILAHPKPLIIIVGEKQSGKTTIAYNILKERLKEIKIGDDVVCFNQERKTAYEFLCKDYALNFYRCALDLEEAREHLTDGTILLFEDLKKSELQTFESIVTDIDTCPLDCSVIVTVHSECKLPTKYLERADFVIEALETNKNIYHASLWDQGVLNMNEQQLGQLTKNFHDTQKEALQQPNFGFLCYSKSQKTIFNKVDSILFQLEHGLYHKKQPVLQEEHKISEQIQLRVGEDTETL